MSSSVFVILRKAKRPYELCSDLLRYLLQYSIYLSRGMPLSRQSIDQSEFYGFWRLLNPLPSLSFFPMQKYRMFSDI